MGQAYCGLIGLVLSLPLAGIGDSYCTRKHAQRLEECIGATDNVTHRYLPVESLNGLIFPVTHFPHQGWALPGSGTLTGVILTRIYKTSSTQQ